MNSSLKKILSTLPKKREKIRIMVFPFDLLSHYLRCIQLVEGSQDDYEIFFAHSERYGNWVREKGFEMFAYQDLDPDHVMECSRRFDFSWMNVKELEAVFEQQIALINQYKPDLVLGDASTTLKMAAEYCDVRFVSLINAYMSKYYASARRLPQTHPAYAYSKKIPVEVFDIITRFAEKIAFRITHKPFRALRKKHGLKKVNSFLDEFEGDYTLICDLPELFPLNPIPNQYKVIGPLFYTSDSAEYEIEQLISNGKKNILVSMGSTGEPGRMQSLLNELFADYNIFFSGKNIFRSEVAHIILKSFINNWSIMDRMDLLICHGGNGTIYQALAKGVPILAATSIFEQEYNMQRVVEKGLGEILPLNFNPQFLKDRIEFWSSKKNSADFDDLRTKINNFIVHK